MLKPRIIRARGRPRGIRGIDSDASPRISEHKQLEDWWRSVRAFSRRSESVVTRRAGHWSPMDVLMEGGSIRSRTWRGRDNGKEGVGIMEVGLI